MTGTMVVGTADSHLSYPFWSTFARSHEPSVVGRANSLLISWPWSWLASTTSPPGRRTGGGGGGGGRGGGWGGGGGGGRFFFFVFFVVWRFPFSLSFPSFLLLLPFFSRQPLPWRLTPANPPVSRPCGTAAEAGVHSAGKARRPN